MLHVLKSACLPRIRGHLPSPPAVIQNHLSFPSPLKRIGGPPIFAVIPHGRLAICTLVPSSSRQCCFRRHSFICIRHKRFSPFFVPPGGFVANGCVVLNDEIARRRTCAFSHPSLPPSSVRRSTTSHRYLFGAVSPSLFLVDRR